MQTKFVWVVVFVFGFACVSSTVFAEVDAVTAPSESAPAVQTHSTPVEQPTSVSATEATPIEFLLFMEIPKVTIASKSEESLLSASGTVYVITDEDIKRYGWRDVREILQAIPNLDLMWHYNWLNGGQRGFTGNFSGTLLMIDGREVQNLLASEAFMTNDFPAHRIKRVEILQGPNSTLYGGNATQGVINIVTKFGDKGDKNMGEAEVLYGDVDTEEISGVFKKNGKDWEIGFSASEFKTQQNWKALAEFAANDEMFSRSDKDPLRYHGTDQFRNHEQCWTADMYARYKGLYVGYDFFKEINTAGLEYVKYVYNNNEARRGYRQMYIGYKDSFLEGDLKAFVEYQNVLEDEDWVLDSLSNTYTPTSVADLEFSLRGESFEKTTRHRVQGQAEYTGFANNYIIAGYDWWKLRIDHLRVQEGAIYPELSDAVVNADFPVEKEETVKNSVFLQDTITLLDNVLKITAGVRYNQQNYTNDSVLPRASVVYLLDKDTAIKLTYGKAFRPPNIFEYIGLPKDQVLASQEMSMYELNYTQNALFGNISLMNILSGYRMDATNLYSKVWVGGGSSQLTGWQTVVGGAFRVMGVEDMLRVKYDRLTGFMGLRYVQPDKTSVAGEDIVLDIPAYKGNLGVSYDILDFLTASLFVNHWAETKTESNKYPLEYTTNAAGDSIVVTEVTTVPAWTSLNLNVNIGGMDLEGMKTTLSLYVENILNTAYYHANVRGASPVQFLQPPRTLRAKLTCEF